MTNRKQYPRIRDFTGASYIRANGEAHRRRATRLDPPFVCLYVAIERPQNWPDTFKSFFRALLESLNQHPKRGAYFRTNQEIIDDLVNAAVDHFDVQREDAQNLSPVDDASINLTASLRDWRWKRAKWRIEAHRDTISITLHVGLTLTTEPDSVSVSIEGLKSSKTQQTADLTREFGREKQGEIEFSPGLAEYLFNDLAAILQKRLDPMFNAIADSYGEDTARRSNAVTALLYGVVTPWTLVRMVEPQESLTPDTDPRPSALFPAVPSPSFPPLDAPRFAATSQGKAVRQTNEFLTRLWSGLERGLLSRETSDSVACYVLGGHGIFISSLGSSPRRSERDEARSGAISHDPRDPVKYLVMYQDPAIKDQTPSSFSRLPSALRANDAEKTFNFSWRLSRFTGRLHDLGAARMGALAQYQYISPFLQHLRDAERALSQEQPDWPGEKLEQIEDDLLRKASAGGMTISHRAALVRYYRDVMKRVTPDLGIIPLPTFQPYDQFLSRRVMGTVDRMVSAKDRYDSFTRKLNSSKISHQSREILKIQKTADIVGTVVFVYYVTEIAYKLSEHFRNVGFVLNGSVITPHHAAILAATLACCFMLPLTIDTWREMPRQIMTRFSRRRPRRG